MAGDLSRIVDLFIIARVADGRAPRTIKDYKRVLCPFSDWCNKANLNLADLERDHIRAYVAHLRANGWADGTVAIHIRNLRAFLNWCSQEEHTQANLAQAVKAPKLATRIESPFSPMEMVRLIAACEGESLGDRRDRAIIMMLYDTGMRADEVLLLRVGDWQANGGTSLLHIYGPKDREMRVVCLGEASTQALADYLAMRGKLDAHAPMWTSVQGKPGDQRRRQALGYEGLRSLVKRRAKAAGLDLKRAHPHIFRKSFTTAFLDAGGDPERLRVLAGWSGYEMLRIYADSCVARLQAAHRRAGPVDNLNLERDKDE